MTRRDIILGGLRALGIVIVGSWPGDWLKVRSLADWNGDLHVYQAYAQACITKLMGWYKPNTGLRNTTGTWNSPNSLEALITYSRLSDNYQYNNLIENTYNHASTTMILGGAPFRANY